MVDHSEGKVVERVCRMIRGISWSFSEGTEETHGKFTEVSRNATHLTARFRCYFLYFLRLLEFLWNPKISLAAPRTYLG